MNKNHKSQKAVRWHIQSGERKKSLKPRILYLAKLSLQEEHRPRDDIWMLVSVRIEFAAGNRKPSY